MSAAPATARKPIAQVGRAAGAGSYTQIPNSFFRLLKCLTPAEISIGLAIFRQTNGWQRAEAEIPITGEHARGSESFAQLTGLSERSIHHALKRLKKFELIPEDCFKPGQKGIFRLAVDKFETVPEPEPSQTVQRKRNPDGSAILAVDTERALCLKCGTVGPVVPLEFEELTEPAEVLIQKILPSPSLNDSTRPPLCRGRHEAAPAEIGRGDGATVDLGGGSPDVEAPAENCRGRAELEPLESYLIQWIPSLGSPFPANFVQQLDARLGGAPLSMFAAGCYRAKDRFTSWGLMLKLADDAREAWKQYGPAVSKLRASVKAKNTPPPDKSLAESISDVVDARWWVSRPDCAAEDRAALMKKFPELRGGAQR